MPRGLINDPMVMKDWQWRFEELRYEGMKKRAAYEVIAQEYGFKPSYVAATLAPHMTEATVMYRNSHAYAPLVFDSPEETLTVEEIAERMVERRPWRQPKTSLHPRRMWNVVFWPRPQTLQIVLHNYQEYSSDTFLLEEVSPGVYKLKR